MNKKRVWLTVFVVVLAVALVIEIRSLGFVINTTSEINVLGPNVPPIIHDLNDSYFACEGTTFYTLFYGTDGDGDALRIVNPPLGPLYIIEIANTNQFEIVSSLIRKGELGGTNVGSRTLTTNITLTDNYNPPCCIDTQQVDVTFIEINNPIEIENIGVQTVWTSGENSTFYHAVGYDDEEYVHQNYGNISFNATVVNATSGAPIDLFNITWDGIISFTANENTSVGNYNVTVCVTDTGLTNIHPNISLECGVDGSATSACDDFVITVTNQNRAPNITSYYPLDNPVGISGEQSVGYRITKYDPDGTVPDSYWFVDGSLVATMQGSSTDTFTHSSLFIFSLLPLPK